MKHASLTRPRMAAILAMVAMFLVSDGDALAQGEPAPALKSLSANGQIAPSDSDRCPVCAMFPARRPQAAAAMTLNNGKTFYFCSNGCLLRSWLRPRAYLNKTRAAIDRLLVQDYFSGKPIDGRSATWVAGSDVIGPMGPAIIALGNAAELAAFQNRHGGKTVFTFDQIDDALWKEINGRDLPAAKTD